MPRKIKNKLPSLQIGKKTIGQRISFFRKKNGLTQKELADKIGIERTLVTAYEIGRLHLNDEMIIRFAIALKVSSDYILGLSSIGKSQYTPNLKITKRINKIEKLPPSQKRSLLNTIDVYLKANAKKDSLFLNY